MKSPDLQGSIIYLCSSISDRERFTMRVGDQRVLRGAGTSGDGGKVE